jgi:hypothetical protein
MASPAMPDSGAAYWVISPGLRPVNMAMNTSAT